MRNFFLAAAALLFIGNTSVFAVPVLQLYVEGASYDQDHESWVFEAVEGDPIRLWVIGNVAGPGGQGTIYDVKLSIVYADPMPGDGGSGVSFGLTGSTTGGYGGFFDPSTPGDPSLTQINENGDLPELYDGSRLLPSHGVYGPGFEWQEFFLGDFQLTDSPIADFIDAFPSAGSVGQGQINAYELTLLSGSVTNLHLDAYDHVQAGNRAKAVFAPFSHDAGTGINHRVPEPAVLGLLAGTLLGLGLLGRRRQH